MEQLRLAYRDFPVPKALISDNDRIFSSWFSKKLADEFGVQHHRNTVASPWENGVAERFVRTVREEVFDRLPPMLGSRQAERIIAEYLPFYNGSRPHLTLDFAAPDGPIRQGRSSPLSFIERVPLFHGLWNDYCWRELAVFR